MVNIDEIDELVNAVNVIKKPVLTTPVVIVLYQTKDDVESLTVTKSHRAGK